jgi:hypothetical protein
MDFIVLKLQRKMKNIINELDICVPKYDIPILIKNILFIYTFVSSCSLKTYLYLYHHIHSCFQRLSHKKTLEYEMWFTIDRYQLPVLYFNN